MTIQLLRSPDTGLALIDGGSGTGKLAEYPSVLGSLLGQGTPAPVAVVQASAGSPDAVNST